MEKRDWRLLIETEINDATRKELDDHLQWLAERVDGPENPFEPFELLDAQEMPRGQ